MQCANMKRGAGSQVSVVLVSITTVLQQLTSQNLTETDNKIRKNDNKWDDKRVYYLYLFSNTNILHLVS